MSAQVTITQLPAAGAITGTELVPIVQNGVTVQTTTSALAGSPVQTQSFLTVNRESSLTNSRSLAVGSGLSLADGGAQAALTVNLTGALANLNGAATGILAKTGISTFASRSVSSSGLGLSVSNGNGISGDPTIQLTGIPASLASTSGTGMMAVIGGSTVANRTITGTSNQISVTGGDGSANPTIAISNDPVVPGSGGITVPNGSTASRPGSPAVGTIRYNTDSSALEAYTSLGWGVIVAGSSVTSFSAGTTGFTPSTPTIGGIVLDGILSITNGGTGNSTGTVANATNVAITATTTGATNYLTFVSSTSGNLPELVNSSITVNAVNGTITGGITGGTF